MATIETFVDDFSTGVGNWQANSSLPYPVYNAVSGHAEVDGSSGNTVLMETVGTYTFQNTWFSIDLVSYYFPTVTTDYSPLVIYVLDDPFTTVVYNAVLTYQQSTDTFTLLDGLGNNSGTFSNPGTTITIGVHEDSGNLTLSYSTDGGTSWTQVGTIADAIDSGSYHLALTSSGTSDATTQLIQIDNFNAVEPPIGSSGPVPITIAAPASLVTVTSPAPRTGIFVPKAAATVTANPHMSVIFNDLHAVDRSSAVPASLTATVPVAGMSITVGLKVDMTGAAGATVTGIPTTGFVYGPPTIAVSPGIVSAVAKSPTFTLSEGTIFISVPTANIQVDGGENIHVITGSFIVGDHWYYPITIRDHGTATFVGSVYNGDDPGDYAPGGHSYMNPNAMVWLYYQADAPEDVTFTWSGSPVYYAWFFTGDSFVDGWTPIAQMGFSDLGDGGPYTSGNTVTLSLNTGLTRISFGFPSNLGSPYDTMTLDWSYVPTNTGLLMDIANDTLDRTPDNLKVSVLGGVSNEYFKFQWSPPASTLIPSSTPRPITLATIKSDAEGNLLTGTIPVPAVFHGTYELVCIGQQSGKIAEANFTILNDPLPQDSDSTDADPVAQPGSKWFWDDGISTQWEMEYSPTAATRVIFPKNLTSQTVTSGTGTTTVWQGVVPSIDWQFNGTLFSESEYNQFMYFFGLNRKFYITNHRGITYIVTLKSFDPKPRKNSDNFWTFDYQCTAIVYGTKGGD